MRTLIAVPVFNEEKYVRRVLTRYFGDHSLMLAGTALQLVGLAGVGLAGGWAALLTSAVLVGLGSALLTPTFTAELSRAGESVQGQAQGMNASAQSLARALGPPAFTAVYGAVGATAPYLIAAGVGLLALLLAWRPLRIRL